MHTQILKFRYPKKLDRVIVNRKRCVHHRHNACGLHVIAQTMLFAEGKQNTHRVTRSLVMKLRDFCISKLNDSRVKGYRIPSWPKVDDHRPLPFSMQTRLPR